MSKIVIEFTIIIFISKKLFELGLFLFLTRFVALLFSTVQASQAGRENQFVKGRRESDSKGCFGRTKTMD